jgi:hypothetical protein
MKQITISDTLSHAANILRNLAYVTENIEQLDLFDLAKLRRDYAAGELKATIANLSQIEWRLRQTPEPPRLRLLPEENKENKK